MDDKLFDVIARSIRECDLRSCEFATAAEVIIEAIEAAGYAVVPVEPTETMVKAGRHSEMSHASVHWVYKAMCAAANKERADA